MLGPQEEPEPAFTHTITAIPHVLYALKETTHDATAHDKLKVRETADGKVEITLAGRIGRGLEQAICDTLPEPERTGFTYALAKHRAKMREQSSPAEQGQEFNVPGLVSEIQGTLEFADTDVFMEYHDWSLLDYSSKMEEDEFTIRETARSFEIDIDGNRVTYQFASEEEQLTLDIAVEGWTPEALVLWLDRQVRQIDIHQGELLKWLRQLVDHLLNTRDMPISGLMRCKFLLAGKIERKIKAIRQQERETVYQQYLFAPESKVTVSFDTSFTFKEGMYWDQRRYRGRWKPLKHFLGPDRVPAFDGAEDGEEMQCAQVIDSLADVKYWIRNVARHPNSFWLPTATDRFYPDFVALLNDDRLLVVEYKGAHISEGADTAEKRTIGALWQRKGEGKGLFVVAEKIVDGRDVRHQLLEWLRSA